MCRLKDDSDDILKEITAAGAEEDGHRGDTGIGEPMMLGSSISKMIHDDLI